VEGKRGDTRRNDSRSLAPREGKANQPEEPTGTEQQSQDWSVPAQDKHTQMFIMIILGNQEKVKKDNPSKASS
jgi:hypothetical protein